MGVGRKAHAILSTNSKIYNYTQAAHHRLPFLQAHRHHQFHYPANGGLLQWGEHAPSCFPCRGACPLEHHLAFASRSPSLPSSSPGGSLKCSEPLPFCHDHDTDIMFHPSSEISPLRWGPFLWHKAPSLPRQVPGEHGTDLIRCCCWFSAVVKHI